MLIQAAITLGGVCRLCLENRAAGGDLGAEARCPDEGQELIRAKMVTTEVYQANRQNQTESSRQLEDRIDDLEEDRILPREVKMMQDAYREALGSLSNSIHQRFLSMEQIQMRFQEDIRHLSEEMAARYPIPKE